MKWLSREANTNHNNIRSFIFFFESFIYLLNFIILLFIF